MGAKFQIISLCSRICCRCFRIQRVKSEIPNRVMRKKLKRRLGKIIVMISAVATSIMICNATFLLLVDEDIGDEAFMPTSTIPIPIVVSVMILFR